MLHLPARARQLRLLLLAGVATLTLCACASPRLASGDGRVQDFSSQSRGEAQVTLSSLSERYKAHPKDRGVILSYSAALRAAGQGEQAVAVVENGLAGTGNDPELRIAYAKALSACGRFEQALTVIDATIRPDVPDWNALSVRGAILDQIGRNGEARASYNQALTLAPDEASLVANLGLSYTMTNDLATAERYLRKAAGMRGATSQIRQNLALVVGLEGRFDESRSLFAAELAPDQVEANMAYMRALLTQQNRWDQIKSGGGRG